MLNLLRFYYAYRIIPVSLELILAEKDPYLVPPDIVRHRDLLNSLVDKGFITGPKLPLGQNSKQQEELPYYALTEKGLTEELHGG